MERIVRKADRSKQIRTVGYVLAHGCALLVHRAAGYHHCHHAARTHQIQGFRDKIIMYHKVVPVIPPVCHFISAERHVADHTVKKAVRVLCRFKSLHGYIVFLVKLLRNLPGNAVKLHAVHL